MIGSPTRCGRFSALALTFASFSAIGRMRRKASRSFATCPSRSQQAMGIQERTRIGGETMLIVGSRNESATFPYGFFKEWRFDMNLGRFGRA